MVYPSTSEAQLLLAWFIGGTSGEIDGGNGVAYLRNDVYFADLEATIQTPDGPKTENRKAFVYVKDGLIARTVEDTSNGEWMKERQLKSAGQKLEILSLEKTYMTMMARTDLEEFGQGMEQGAYRKVGEALQTFFIEKDGKMVLDEKALTFYDQEQEQRYEVESKQAQTLRAQAVAENDPKIKAKLEKQAFAIEKSLETSPVKAFNDVKDWLSKTDFETARKNTAAGLCHVIGIYLLAQGTGKETRSFPEFYTDELRKGNISMSSYVNSEGQTIRGAFYGMGSAAWCDRYGFNRNENTKGAFQDMQRSGKTVAMAWQNTDNTPGADHFMIIAKDKDGIWRNCDHTSRRSERRGGYTNTEKIESLIYPK